MAANNVRTPRARVLADGAALGGVVAIDVGSNNHNAADRFTVSLALAANPSLTGNAASLSLDVQCSLDGLAYTSLVSGRVDSIVLDPLRGAVRLEGRDRTADLIDSRTQDSFSNRTSSEIASLLAARHGLTASVTATRTLVGRYYEADHDRVTLNSFSRATTEWDLLTTLAGHEGFDVYVRGDTLHFEPTASASTPPAIVSPADCTDLRLERALTLARDIEVTVKSWNSRQQSAFTQTARSTGGGGHGGASGPPQKYVYVEPNLTTDAALQLAQRRLAELSAHERVVTFAIPGELSLTPRSRIALRGTGTDFDQTYAIDRIDRRLSQQSGFTQTVRAKNASTASQATTPSDIVASTAAP